MEYKRSSGDGSSGIVNLSLRDRHFLWDEVVNRDGAGEEGRVVGKGLVVRDRLRWGTKGGMSRGREGRGTRGLDVKT